jgi:nucleoside transporter
MGLDSIRFRLIAMMFGQFLIMGTWIVTLPTFLMASPILGGMNFPAPAAAWIYGTVAMAGIVAPFFVGLLADRLFSAEHLMFFLHILGAGLLIGAGAWCDHKQPRMLEVYQQKSSEECIDGRTLTDWERHLHRNPKSDEGAEIDRVRTAIHDVNVSPEIQAVVSESFVPLFLLMFAYAFCSLLTLTICNTIAFRNLPDPRQSFGHVRLFGTVGWIVAGLQLDLFWTPLSSMPLYLAGGMSVAFGIFCLFLPHTPPAGQGRSISDSLGIPALSMFREPSFCVLIFCALGIAAVQQFYSVYANRFLTELATPRPTATQTIAQVSEVICMALFPLVMARFGFKWTMALGIVAWIGRNGIFATVSLPWIVGLGLPLHGLSYSFFFLVASIYIDRKAPPHFRGSAQGIFTFVSMGAGTLFGNYISARIVQGRTIGHTVAWSEVWLIPSIASAAIFFIFLIFFRLPEEPSTFATVQNSDQSTR